MALPRRRSHDDHDLPELPPLGDDDVDPALDVGNDLDLLLDDPSSLDDSAADELTLDDVDVPADTGALDDADGPVDTGDDADEIDHDDSTGWTNDDAREPDDGSEIDDVGELVADDQGLEGPDGEAPDELDVLPPLDDDPEGDRYVGDDPDELPELAAFALEARAGASTRLALGGSAPSVLAVASGLCVGRDRLYVVGDALVALSRSALDDPGARFEAIEGVSVDELFSSVLEDASGALWLGAFSGDVWRRSRDAWRRVASLSEGRSSGAVELALEGRHVWALTALGTLHKTDDGVRFEATLAREHVRSLAVDARGGVLAVVSGRRRDPVRASIDGGRTWSTLTLPDEVSVRCAARASDVCVVACAAGPGYVSVDGGATWSAWPLLAGATALALVEADDGDARLFFAAHDESADRVALATARVGARAEPVAACRIAELDDVFPRAEGDDDEASHRVERVVALDRAGRHLALVTSRGALVLVSLPA